MTPETLQLLAIVFTVWGIAVAAKAINALRTGIPYTFSLWDGGLLRAGKTLNRLGMQIKVVVGVLMALGCIVLLTHALPLATTAYTMMFVAVLSLVSDMVTGS
jgi:hypothetical protein